MGVILKDDARRERLFYPAEVALARRLSLERLDTLTALGFAVAAAIEAVVRSPDPGYLAVNLTGAPLLLILAARRSRALLALLVICGGAVVGTLLQAWLVPDISSDAFVPILALLLAVFSVGAHGTGRSLAIAAPLPLFVVLIVDTTRPHSDPLTSALVFFAVFVVGLPLAAGRIVRHRGLLIARLEAQAAELDHQRSSHLAAAVARERVRMAAELDVGLAEGMHGLLEVIERVGMPESFTEVEAVELRARALLGRTREVVVALTADPTADIDIPSGSPHTRTRSRFAELAQPWTCLFAASVAAGLLVETRTAHVEAPRLVVWVAVVVMAAPLALAWARPLLATVLGWTAAAVVEHQVVALRHLTTPIALTFVLPFMVAALEPRRRALLGLVCCWSGVLAVDGAKSLPGNAVVAALCWLLGTGLRASTELADQLKANNVLLERGRAALTADVLADERARLARELHDAVGHSLTVVALQAGAARRIWHSDQPRAAAMIATTRAAVAEGLRELQTALAEPAHDQRSLALLIEQARRSGLRVSAHVDDTITALAEPLRLVVYRIVQEGLTNAVKHSPGAEVRIAVRDTCDALEIDVTNGPPTQRPLRFTPSGHGLDGMRLRLQQLDGSLSQERLPDGGFRLCARLPMPAGVE